MYFNNFTNFHDLKNKNKILMSKYNCGLLKKNFKLSNDNNMSNVTR